MKKLSLMLTLILSVCLTANAQWSIDDVTPMIMATAQGATALAWGDIDSDGNPDLFVGANGGQGSHLFKYSRAGWEDLALPYGVYEISDVVNAQFIDYNLDGHLDLFCLTNGHTPVLLYKQLENGRLQLQNLIAGNDSETPPTSAAWCDLNDDGLPELILNNGDNSESDLVILQQSGDNFIEVRGSFPQLPTDVGAISVVDFDRDGDQDIFFGTRNDSATRLFEKTVDGYRDATDENNIFTKMIDKGATWADFDLDGNQDCFCFGNTQYTGLYYGVPSMQGFSYTNRIDEFDLRELAGDAVDARAVDANNDGWTDIMIVHRDAAYTYILLNDEGQGWSGGWTVPPDFGNPQRLSYACAWADYDHDGDMDYALSMGHGGVRLYKNVPPIDKEWIEVNICGTETDTPLPHASMLVEFEHGSKPWLSGSTSNSSVGSDDAHYFAVNTTSEKSDEIVLTVFWHDGTFAKYYVYPQDIRTTITLHKPTSVQPTTAPAELPDLIIPLAMENSPNPFNPSTTINFTVPEAGQVRLSVFNLLGQEVAELTNGYMDQGSHSLNWNASALPSGLYFARLEAANQTKLNRMLLTK